MERFTKNAADALEKAKNIALSLGQNYVGTEHILTALVETRGVAAKVLKENNVDSDKLRQVISSLTGSGNSVAVAERGLYTPRASKVIEDSVTQAAKTGTEKAGTEHILLAILNETDCIAVRILTTLGVNIQKIYNDLFIAAGMDPRAARNEMNARGRNKKSQTSVLDRFTTDLTKYASEGRLDPCIGRDNEINRMIQILSRRTKNNPCLIGEPGVGKTAVVEGLAIKIAEEDVPDNLLGKRILSLDISGMVAGTKYRGEFEERIKNAVNEAKNAGNIILFIDEIHMIIGAGGAEGSVDAANILKPSLARGEIQVIGATTSEEYRKHIEKDTALERRFQSVVIEEPDEENAIEMIKGLVPVYEKHHKVTVSPEAVNASVKMTARFVSDRFLPDKAIDALDEACARVAMKKHLPSPELRRLEEEDVRIEKKKEDAIQNEDYELAGRLKKLQREIRSQTEALRRQRTEKTSEPEYTVTESDIADVVSDWTKIPVKKVSQEENERLKNLESILHERVVGQDEAVKAVAAAIRRGRTGLRDPGRPIGSFLFLGPTGVGKTELSKALADAVFGKRSDIIRVDMSEYMEKYSVSKMIGSPPGYVGYDEGGQLSEKVRKHPYSVILFDEIEKAHPDVFNILLQILDEGHITDSQGRKVSFKNTIIIMTSNAGAQRIMSPSHLGFGTKDDAEADYAQMKESVMEEVKNIFKPEFINRIDEIIVFHMLTQENIQDIVRIFLRELEERVKASMNVSLDFTDGAVKHLAEKGFDKNYGARPVRRAIQTEVEDKLADMIVDGALKAGMHVTGDFSEEKGTLDFTVKSPESSI